MLTSLGLDNWKSFGAGAGFAIAPLTLLVGPNGSGKSNVLDALRFLQGTARDYPLREVLGGRHEGLLEVWPPIRGSLFEAPRKGADVFGLTTGWRLDDRDYRYTIEVACAADASVHREKLEEGEHVLFDSHASWLGQPVGRSGVSLPVTIKIGDSAYSTGSYSAVRAVLGQIQPVGSTHPDVVWGADRVHSALRDAVFLDVRPDLMRQYRPFAGGSLGSSAENIAPVLRALPPERLADVVGWMEELVGPEVVGIEFNETQLREVMLMFVEEGGRRISARSLSDGTLRFLGELVALLTAPPGTLVVLEEPDAGLHPARIRLLAELLETVTSTEGGGIQVLATTHSPTLLAHLSREALGNVVAFGRDRASGTSVCSRLRDLEHFDTLAGAPDIDHLVSTGWIERAL